MNSNPLRLDMYDLVRRAIARSLSNTPDKEWNTLLPEYRVILPLGFPGKNIRDLATLSTKQHGKRRIYSDISLNAPNSLHLFYVSKKDIIRLTGRTTGEIVDMFSNRWCVSLSNPSIICKSFTEFVKGVICIESEDARRNHPIAGTTDSEWRFGPFISKLLKRNVASTGTKSLICRIEKRR